MGRFICKFLTFIFLLFACLLLSDYLLTSKIQSSKQREYASWNDIMHGSASADVIIMGNSRAWAQYSPQILGDILHMDAYNIGIDGSCINRQVTRYKIYRNYNSRPAIIVHNIDFMTMGFTTGTERYQYFPYFWDMFFRNAVFPTEPFSFAEKYIPFYRYSHFGVKNMFLDPRTLVKGYSGNDIPWDGSKLAEQTSLRFSLDPRAIEIYKSFLAESQAEGVKVIMVFAPMYSVATSMIENIEEMYDFYTDMARQYDAQIIDYNFDPMCQDTSYFFNATHLNKRGAELFSQKLGMEMAKMMHQEE